MCGIGVLVAGISIDLASVLPLLSSSPKQEEEHVVISLDNLKSALGRRGPDSLGSKTLLIPDPLGDRSHCVSQLHFVGATLQLRGLSPVAQPFSLPDGNILLFNGEIFGGIDVDSDSNDGEVLLRALGSCCSCSSGHNSSCSGERKSVPELLSLIKGPWAVIYWQDCSKTLWFGRDAFGRRSLLVHWPSQVDSQLLLSSVSPFPSLEQQSGLDFNNRANPNPNFWEELTCGMYSLTLKLTDSITGEVRKHEWCNAKLVNLIEWERADVKPRLQDLQSAGLEKPLLSSPADNVLSALRKSVMLRVSAYQNFQEVRFGNREEDFVPVAVLFSGGLDSMILAALLDECLDPGYVIDLLNVSFDHEFAPDRISAKAGLEELKRIAPSRRWKLVEIDYDLSDLSLELLHVMSLINPASTYMDLNIGVALWLAASGDGWVCQGTGNDKDGSYQRIRYKSEAKIVLVGAGADEQCAGYGRHRTKYRSASWVGLHEEMKLDMQRIWKRNMGRDDRCIADNGKEARFPFLDEDVIQTLLQIPLWKIVNLDQPAGIGDKKILREVAVLLGLHKAAVMPKRAIQFGSRIARESNRRNFGSNRAANLASAGSATINIS